MKIQIQKQEIEKSLQGTQYKIAIQKYCASSSAEGEDDLNFPSQLTSIGIDIRADLNISWQHIQQLCKQPNYSENIQDIAISEYCNKSITNCLLIMSWYTQPKFMSIFSNRTIPKSRVYEYAVMVQGIIYKIVVNSKVPIKDGKILFAEMVENSIFPSIFQKSIAKIYGNYESISDSVVELLQIWTGYALQTFSISRYNESQFISFFESALQNRSLSFFRTRNSTKLEKAGLVSNTEYLIVRVLQINGMKLIQFMELNGQKWKGKYSKFSDYWKEKENQIYLHKISLQGLFNYIQIKDLIGISRQFEILHNTQNFTTNWLKSSAPKTKHTFSLTLSFSSFTQNSYNSNKNNLYQVLVSLHFTNRMCRNTMYLVCEDTCQLMSCNFKQNRNASFVAAFLRTGIKYLLYVYAEDIQGKGVCVNVTVHSSNMAWCQIKQVEKNIAIQEKSLLQFMQNLPCISTELDTTKKSVIKIKNLYNQLGLGLVSITLAPSYENKIKMLLDRQRIRKLGLQVLNCSEKQKTYNSPCYSILILKFKPKFQYNAGDPFPPSGCIQFISQRVQIN